MNSSVNAHKTRFAALLSLLLIVFGTGSLWASGKKETAAAAPAEEKIVYQEDFEKSNGGWAGRGSEKVSVVAGKAQSGSKSLMISARTQTWNGPIKNLTTVMKPGQTYRITFWAMFDEGPETQGINISIQRDVDGVGQEFTTVGGDTLPKGDWGRFEVIYSVPRVKYETPLSLYFETPYKSGDSATPDDLIPFYVDNVTITRLAPLPPPEAEKDIPNFHEFFPEFGLGAAIDPVDLTGSGEKNELLRHFNVYVFGNDMKQDAMQPQEGTFRFEKPDLLMAYAAKNGKKVRGHTLVWHNQFPAWLVRNPNNAGENASKELLLKRMETHIKTVVGRYKGKVDSWDVVNEAIEADGTLRKSKYLEIVGSDEYIAKAFQWAREADPDAKLFINDYNIEYSGAKQDGLYNLVAKLKGEGVPIDGVGLQAHISIGHPTVGDMRTAIRRFAELGVKVQITELDMSIYANSSEARKEPNREIFLDQANKYKALFEMFREEAKLGNLDMVMLWGLADLGTWLDSFPVVGRPDHPLLFGKDLRAKPAYWAIVNPEKLPIAIKKTDAIRVKDAAVSADHEMWKYVSARPIEDRKGNSFGSFKLLWSDGKVHALVNVLDSTKDAGDKITLYVEPKNLKEAKKGDAVMVIEALRSSAVTDDGKAYTLLVDIAHPAKLATRIGFDIKVTDGNKTNSWNDLSNNQDNASENYGIVQFKELPPITNAKRGTVRIDGQIDPVWNSVEAVPMNVKTQGFVLEGSTFKALWDDEYLYVLFEVKDDLLNDKARDPWEQDSVEVFIDQNNGKTTTYEDDDGQYRISYRNTASFNGGNPDLFKSKSRIFPGGYIVEVAVPFTHVKPLSGLLIGFDAQVNEADASGVRTGIRNWVNGTNMGYQDMSGLGVLMLME